MFLPAVHGCEISSFGKKNLILFQARMRRLGLINPTEKAMSSYSISREATGVIVQARENLKLKLETKNQLFG